MNKFNIMKIEKNLTAEVYKVLITEPVKKNMKIKNEGLPILIK